MFNFRTDLAKQYLQFLTQNNMKPNLATMGKYLRLLYNNNIEHKISTQDEEEILHIYEEIRKNNPVLDSLTLDSILLALSLTREWRKCLDLLQVFKKKEIFPSIIKSKILKFTDIFRY